MSSASGFGTLRGDKAELVEMPAQGVDERRALPDKEVARPVQHEHALLLDRLDRTKRMPGRVTASQMAAASAASFFCLRT